MDASTVQQWLLAFAEQTAEHAIVLLDLQFTVLWANAAATQILGLPAARMIGVPAAPILHAGGHRAGHTGTRNRPRRQPGLVG